MILGVDPGMTGALAIVDAGGQLQWVLDMPTMFESPTRKGRRRVDPLSMAVEIEDILKETNIVIQAAFVEKVHSMPGQGVASAFTFGHGYGVVLGTLGAMKFPVLDVTPQAWKKTHGLGRAKDASRAMALRLWPEHRDSFKLKKHEGRAEAALIALHGAKTYAPDNPF